VILDEILLSADARAGVAAGAIDRFKAAAEIAPRARSFAAALERPSLGVIAEIKRRSPSAGDIASELDPVVQAVAYQAGGADAISVLTEPDFFGGSLDDLMAVRDAVNLPILRKDFTRNRAQIWEARAAGADAVLLIVATMTEATLVELVEEADDVGIDAMVEAHSVDEVKRAEAAGASIIGVNNRDLTTFVTDLAVAEAAAPFIRRDVVGVAESGVWDAEAAGRMHRAGYDAILVGEALVRHPDPAAFVAELKRAR
jgi:indole-3-glycerol phosphate synthase